MINYLRNHKLLTLLVLAAIVIVIILAINQKRGVPTPKSTPLPSAQEWNGITPGVSTQQDVINQLGQPRSESSGILLYESKSPTRDNQVVIQNGTAVLIKEIVAFTENRTIDEITSKYGTADNVLYGDGAVNGNYLFVYLSKGIAYLGNPDTKSLQEIWYFPPVSSVDGFISKWAQGYSKEQSGGQF